MLQTTLEMPESEIKKARSEVAKQQMILSGGAFGKGSREAATEIYYKNNIEKLGMPYETFRHMLNNTSGIKKKIETKSKESNVPGLRFESFKDFYKAFCDLHGWVPEDKIMNKFAKLGKWSGTNAGSTRIVMESKDGYKFTRTPYGFDVEVPISRETILATLAEATKAIEETDEKIKDLQEFRKVKKMVVLKAQRHLKHRGSSSAA